MERPNGNVWASWWIGESAASGTSRTNWPRYAVIALSITLQLQPKLCGSTRVRASSDDGARGRRTDRAWRCWECYRIRKRELRRALLSEPLPTAIRQPNQSSGRSFVQAGFISSSYLSEPAATVYRSITFAVRPAGISSPTKSSEFESGLRTSHLPLSKHSVSTTSTIFVPSPAIPVSKRGSRPLCESCIRGTWISGYHSGS